MAVLQYTTLEGERWDSISQKAYGTPLLSNLIIEANPLIPISDVLPAGILLDIPVQEVITENMDPDLLPPWKR
jgi:phage tail protein X